MIEIFECPGNEAAEWNRFVSGHIRSTYAHRYEMKTVIEKTYGNKTVYLCAREDGKMAAVFPLVIMPGFRGGKSFVSVAYNSYGGILRSGGDEAEIRRAFLGYIRGKYPECATIEERSIAWEEDDYHSDGCPTAEATTSGAITSEVTMICDISEFSAPDRFLGKVDGKKRNQIRKGMKQGFASSWDKGLLGRLYEIYLVNMGAKGTPVHPVGLYENILESFGDDCELLTVLDKGKVVGGFIGIRHNGMFTTLMASVLSEYNALCANDFLYWEWITHAIETRLSFFDFGRSEAGSGTYRFKKQWATRQYRLNYTRYKADGSPLAGTSMKAYRGGWGKLFSSLWKKAPLAAQRRLGPGIRRFMP